jgi:hypothetical protein
VIKQEEVEAGNKAEGGGESVPREEEGLSMKIGGGIRIIGVPVTGLSRRSGSAVQVVTGRERFAVLSVVVGAGSEKDTGS